MTDYMDCEVATIWVKVGDTKRKSIMIGGLYREHQILGRGETHDTRIERQRKQAWRWRRMCRKWKEAGRRYKTVVIGDLNLDKLRWENPEQHLTELVEVVQDNIENEGFVQIVAGHTRTWRQQADSLLDQVWTNCANRIIKSLQHH